jgi:uncharacterized metal-binding protein
MKDKLISLLLIIIASCLYVLVLLSQGFITVIALNFLGILSITFKNVLGVAILLFIIKSSIAESISDGIKSVHKQISKGG